jgi:hypothetical protein
VGDPWRGDDGPGSYRISGGTLDVCKRGDLVFNRHFGGGFNISG